MCGGLTCGLLTARGDAHRAKKLAALDECVTKDWTTTQDNYGNYHQCVSHAPPSLRPRVAPLG